MGRGVCCLCAAALLLLASGVQASLVIERAERKIDVSTFTARHQTRLALRNDGKEAQDTLLLCDTSDMMSHVAMMEVAGGSADKPARLAWKPAPAQPGWPADAECRAFTLPEPLSPGGSTQLMAAALLTHVMRPEPAEIRQRDVQRVVYRHGARLLSPYKVETQSTEIALGRVNEAPTYTTVEPTKRSTESVTYGPYQGTQPFTSEPITVHYENVHPFVHVTELEREVEVSHWGNVYTEERYSVRHAGAKIVGEWSRYDLMTRPQEFARSGVPSLAAVVPAGSHSLYFRDSIGNISSSETRHELEQVSVNLQPRYPLFGGWSIKFLFGWSLPLSKVVSKDRKSGRMVLSSDMSPSIRDVVVDELVVKVVLPEGATTPRVSTTVALAAPVELSHAFTYLDVMGRPVVVLRARNVVSDMPLPFQVEYSYSSLGLLQKPLLLAGAFGLLFAAAILFNLGGASLAGSPSVQAMVKAHAS